MILVEQPVHLLLQGLGVALPVSELGLCGMILFDDGTVTLLTLVVLGPILIDVGLERSNLLLKVVQSVWVARQILDPGPQRLVYVQDRAAALLALHKLGLVATCRVHQLLHGFLPPDQLLVIVWCWLGWAIGCRAGKGGIGATRRCFTPIVF